MEIYVQRKENWEIFLIHYPSSPFLSWESVDSACHKPVPDIFLVCVC